MAEDNLGDVVESFLRNPSEHTIGLEEDDKRSLSPEEIDQNGRRLYNEITQALVQTPEFQTEVGTAFITRTNLRFKKGDDWYDVCPSSPKYLRVVRSDKDRTSGEWADLFMDYVKNGDTGAYELRGDRIRYGSSQTDTLPDNTVGDVRRIERLIGKIQERG